MRGLAAKQINATLGTFKSLPRSQSFSLPFSKEKALETRLFESKMAAPLPTRRSLTETENSRPLFQRSGGSKPPDKRGRGGGGEGVGSYIHTYIHILFIWSLIQ